ncbi:hypothetical protein CHS0354_010014 [Potamilus streckersoni]|uniref:Uncharacterized protein n=1 Tax=Potamilus streckersoni TaxID=2493646 RepID=A0AAE0VU88_9BIVA|nr:hypothetical protein CHS0354_010014 [Potamilus streckersoni]
MSHRRWDLHLDKLMRTGKIERAALIDHTGCLLAASPDFILAEHEIIGILSALGHQYSHLVKLKIAHEVFTCFQNIHNNDVLIGRTENAVLVLHTCKDFVVVALADPESPGSCMYEILHVAS